MSASIAWKNLEKQYFSNNSYRELKVAFILLKQIVNLIYKNINTKERLKELHKNENKSRAAQNKRKICPFEPDSEVNFNQLLNFNKIEEKKPINMEVLEFMHLLMDEW